MNVKETSSAIAHSTAGEDRYAMTADRINTVSPATMPAGEG